MQDILRCVIYLFVIGVVLFLVGKKIPRKWMKYNSFPFRSFDFEKEGKIYNAIGIRKWKSKLPDISKILPGSIPAKKLPRDICSEDVERLIQETCVAELIHSLLAILGFGCAMIWKGVGGWVLSVLYMFGNLLYNIIQRYNRPKLLHLMMRIKDREILDEEIKAGV